jgi:hypothetical protein
MPTDIPVPKGPSKDSFLEVWGGPDEWRLRPCSCCGRRTSSPLKDEAGRILCGHCWVQGGDGKEAIDNG